MYTVPQGLLKHLHRTLPPNRKIVSESAERVVPATTVKQYHRNIPKTFHIQDNNQNPNNFHRTKYVMSSNPHAKMPPR